MIWRWLARARHDRPVPGVEDTGLIGWAKTGLPPSFPPAPPPAPGRRPHPPAPAPGHGTSRHETGGLAYFVKGWQCGCEIQYDAQGAVVYSWPCTASRPDFDDWLKGLTP